MSRVIGLADKNPINAANPTNGFIFQDRGRPVLSMCFVLSVLSKLMFEFSKLRVTNTDKKILIHRGCSSCFEQFILSLKQQSETNNFY